MRTNELDTLIAGLAVVRDDELGTAFASPQADAIFDEIVRSKPRADQGQGRRRGLLLAAAAATALVVTPAFAFRGHLVHLFSGSESAPTPVERSFRVFDAGAAEKWRLGTARKVLEVSTPDGPVVIWAAPAQGGGFCYGVGTAGREGDASTCQRPRPLKLAPFPFSIGKPDDDLVGAPVVFAGYTVQKKAVSIQVRFNGGESASVPLTWVSPPIDAGWFVLWVPKKHWQDLIECFDFVARDSDGGELGHHQPIDLIPDPAKYAVARFRRGGLSAERAASCGAGD